MTAITVISCSPPLFKEALLLAFEESFIRENELQYVNCGHAHVAAYHETTEQVTWCMPTCMGPPTWTPSSRCWSIFFYRRLVQKYLATTAQRGNSRWRIQQPTTVGSNEFWLDERQLEAPTCKWTAWITPLEGGL
jgi:hypothetical protein